MKLRLCILFLIALSLIASLVAILRKSAEKIPIDSSDSSSTIDTIPFVKNEELQKILLIEILAPMPRLIETSLFYSSGENNLDSETSYMKLHGAAVSIYNGSSEICHGSSDIDGRCSFALNESNKVEILVKSKDYADYSSNISLYSLKKYIQVRLSFKNNIIRGKVQYNDKPQPNHQVYISGKQITTDGNGYFEQHLDIRGSKNIIIGTSSNEYHSLPIILNTHDINAGNIYIIRLSRVETILESQNEYINMNIIITFDEGCKSDVVLMKIINTTLPSESKYLAFDENSKNRIMVRLDTRYQLCIQNRNIGFAEMRLFPRNIYFVSDVKVCKEGLGIKVTRIKQTRLEVVDCQNNPLSGAIIQINIKNWNTMLTTDSDGYAPMCLLESDGTAYLQISKEGYANRYLILKYDETAEEVREVMDKSACELVVYVEGDEIDKDGPFNMIILPEGLENEDSVLKYSTLSIREGIVGNPIKISNLAKGIYTILVYHEGLSPEKRIIKIDNRNETVHLNLRKIKTFLSISISDDNDDEIDIVKEDNIFKISAIPAGANGIDKYLEYSIDIGNGTRHYNKEKGEYCMFIPQGEYNIEVVEAKGAYIKKRMKVNVPGQVTVKLTKYK